jgi:hypothetical protein
MSDPPLVSAISEDPLLRDTKLIAEAWDCDGLYQVRVPCVCVCGWVGVGACCCCRPCGVGVWTAPVARSAPRRVL